MSSSNKTFTTATVAVREDDLAAMLRFISVQHSVVQAAVPRCMYGLQAEARRQLQALMPILNKYKFAEDTVTITVNLGHGERQIVSVSHDALASKTYSAACGTANEENLVKVEVCVPIPEVII